MKYSKKDIGIGLKQQLEKGFNIERISNWADNFYFSFRGERSEELDNILRSIYIMDAGPEFQYSEEELRLLADMLVNEESDPIKKMSELKNK